MDKATYASFLRTARAVTRRPDEAEDLLQSVLVAALEAKRSDLTCVDNRRWLMGALRKRALFDARTAIRRRLRDCRFALQTSEAIQPVAFPSDFINTLPPAQRTTALLVLSGHTRREIAWLLRVSDAALRQRIREIRRCWRHLEDNPFNEFPGLGSTLSYGRMRQSMLGVMGRSHLKLASHDPDGHIFAVSSQKRPPRQL